MTARLAENDMQSILRAACMGAGIDAEGAETVVTDTTYKLPDGVVVRISGPGQKLVTMREVAVARWLESNGVRAARVVPGVQQPVVVDGRAVTFWRELPPHRPATPVEVAGVLAQLHGLPLPEFELRRIAPLARMEQEIAAAQTLTEDDRRWLRAHLAELRGRWAGLPAGLPWCVVRDDARGDHVVVAEDGNPILLGPARVSIGPPGWDLVHTAIRCWSLASITAEQYADFCRRYGHDVTRSGGYFLLRDIQEFQMTVDAARAAALNPDHHRQAVHRLACLRGDEGVRPWEGWTDLDQRCVRLMGGGAV